MTRCVCLALARKARRSEGMMETIINWLVYPLMAATVILILVSAPLILLWVARELRDEIRAWRDGR